MSQTNVSVRRLMSPYIARMTYAYMLHASSPRSLDVNLSISRHQGSHDADLQQRCLRHARTAKCILEAISGNLCSFFILILGSICHMQHQIEWLDGLQDTCICHRLMLCMRVLCHSCICLLHVTCQCRPVAILRDCRFTLEFLN